MIDLRKGIRFTKNLEPLGSRIRTGQAISSKDNSIIWYSVGVDQDGMLVLTLDEKTLDSWLNSATQNGKLDSEQLKYYISGTANFMFLRAMETLGHASNLNEAEPSRPGGCSNCGAFFDVVWNQVEKGVFSPTIVSRDSFIIWGPDYSTTHQEQFVLFFPLPDAGQ
jgi:hypothetical protein